MNEIRTKHFRDKSFNFIATDQHASWFTFEDEEEVRERHWYDIKPGDVVINGGAGFGSYALPALAQGATVYIFSPEEADTELLRRNLSVNPDFANRAIVVPVGLHGQPGWFDPDTSVFCSLRDGLKKAIRVYALDEFCSDMGRVDWINLDVEGAEAHVMRGAAVTIKRFRPKLLIENHLMHDPKMAERVIMTLAAIEPAYCGETHPHHSISHSFFWVP